MSSKLCFLMTWICMRQIKLTFMQCNMIKVIWTFWRMKLGLLLQFYFCQGIANFHIEIFIGQIHLTHNEAVSCAISRNRFREILSNFHLVDNTQIKEDRYCEVQVLFQKLNFNFKQCGSFVNHSVDESIIPYYGKHGTKQFIRGMSIRFGFKHWWITSSEGYLLHAEP